MSGESGSKLPVPSDARALSRRLAAEERQLVERLAALEERVRRFSDVERPAYASWRRLEFGPQLATLQELSDELRMRGILANRVQDLVERDGLHPREALYMVEHPEAWPSRAQDGGFDPDEVEARRRAKRDRKRAERREAKRAKRAAERSAETVGSSSDAAPGTPRSTARVVDLYRALARRIHPDSPAALRTVTPDRLGALWTDVQDAYESGSLDRLLAIAAWVETLAAAGEDAAAQSRRTPHGDDRRAPLRSFAERYERLRALRRSMRALERDLLAMQDEPAWGFAEERRATARELVRRTRAAIDGDVERVRRDLAELGEWFRDIGPPRAPRFARRR
ncbi:hypothetical protein K2Z84_33640 [Candidatus Binatia bacterium]|nr:hypothetical protein [Candidatus Binatia bacterium]